MGAALLAASAWAITVPDVGNCSIGSDCLQITNTSAAALAGYGSPGVYGNALNGIGVKGVGSGGSSTGVYGTSPTRGVQGDVTATNGVGVMGTSSATTSTGTAGIATGNSSKGVSGSATGTSSYGVYGNTSNDSSYAVYGLSDFGSNSYGVYGKGQGTGSIGVYGTSLGSYGVYGETSASASNGVFGKSTVGIAVRGDGSTRGVHGHASASGGIGVSGAALQGSTGAKGVYGVMDSPGVGNAIYGDNPSSVANAYAGFFNGNVRIVGVGTGNNLSVTGNIWASGTITQGGSDSRLKKNIEPIADAMGQMLKLRGVTYQWKDPEQYTGPGTHVGFIAQEVEKVFPHWVGVSDKGFRTLNTTELDGLVVESIRTLKTENDALRDRVRALENRQPFATAGLNGNGLLGLGLMALGAAIVVSRRRSTAPSA